MVAVCSDVSVQVRARKELETANRRLEEFAYVASHDLQEPPRMVGIYTQLLLRRIGAKDPETEAFAAFVRHGVDRMQQLISWFTQESFMATKRLWAMQILTTRWRKH
jgi:light-regulated signal transduction histidine kinase (bacteriophytochrome)